MTVTMREDVNEYGTPVGAFTCQSCGREFTVCPRPADPERWAGCTHPECPSYDAERDAEPLFMPDAEFAALPVVGLSVARVRRHGAVLLCGCAA